MPMKKTFLEQNLSEKSNNNNKNNKKHSIGRPMREMKIIQKNTRKLLKSRTDVFLKVLSSEIDQAETRLIR
jgi:hypothetical protein